MDELILIEPTAEYAAQIEEYRTEFPQDMRLTFHVARIPGMDHAELYENVLDWLAFCETMRGKVTWYMSVRKSDGRIVGFFSLRHALEYDDDDIEFASHIGYSIRPSEQGKGYGRKQLLLALEQARELGIDPARIVCRDDNAASNALIRACGGVYVDSIHGEISGLTVNRYDVRTAKVYHSSRSNPSKPIS